MQNDDSEAFAGVKASSHLDVLGSEQSIARINPCSDKRSTVVITNSVSTNAACNSDADGVHVNHYTEMEDGGPGSESVRKPMGNPHKPIPGCSSTVTEGSTGLIVGLRERDAVAESRGCAGGNPVLVVTGSADEDHEAKVPFGNISYSGLSNPPTASCSDCAVSDDIVGLGTLHFDLFFLIFKHLDIVTLSRIRGVCRLWNEVCSSATVKKSVMGKYRNDVTVTRYANKAFSVAFAGDAEELVKYKSRSLPPVLKAKRTFVQELIVEFAVKYWTPPEGKRKLFDGSEIMGYFTEWKYLNFPSQSELLASRL